MGVHFSEASTLSTTWNILIIDDDEDDFILAREMLKVARGQKFEVQWCSTYAAGQEALRSDLFHAVLVDYDLGSHSGIELIREANAWGYSSPLILFTGRGSYEVDVEAMESGATLYLTKSEVNPLLLERAIRYAIEMKQKENELRRSRDLFSKTFRYTPAAMTLISRSTGRYVDANPSFCKLVGFSREEIIGHFPVELGFFLPAEREQVLRKFRDEGYIHHEELTVVSKDGKYHQVLFSLDPIELADGEGVLTTMVDITDRYRAEKEKRESDAR